MLAAAKEEEEEEPQNWWWQEEGRQGPESAAEAEVPARGSMKAPGEQPELSKRPMWLQAAKAADH